MNEQQYEMQAALAPRIWEYILAGLLLAAGCGAAMGYHIYHGFVTEEIGRNQAYWGIGLPFVGVAAGLYIFAYGWQRGDVEKAIKMSMWLSLGVVGAIAAILSAFALRGAAKSAGKSALDYHDDYYTRPRSGLRIGFGWPHRRRGQGLQYGDPAWSRYTLFGHTVFGGGDKEEQRSGPQVFEVHCRNCGGLFRPQPPRAQCPNCGHSALDKAG